jgi:hypothetical protein
MDSLISTLKWSSEIVNPAGKQKVAQQIAAMVKDGDVLGVGSGSTVYMALLAICRKDKGRRIKRNGYTHIVRDNDVLQQAGHTRLLPCLSIPPIGSLMVPTRLIQTTG